MLSPGKENHHHTPVRPVGVTIQKNIGEVNHRARGDEVQTRAGRNKDVTLLSQELVRLKKGYPGVRRLQFADVAEMDEISRPSSSFTPSVLPSDGPNLRTYPFQLLDFARSVNNRD